MRKNSSKMIVDYLNNKIEKNIMGTTNEEIRKDLNLASSSTCDVLQKLNKQGQIFYSRGQVILKNKIENLDKRKIRYKKSNISDNYKINCKYDDLYNYLVNKTKNNEIIPTIEEIARELGYTKLVFMDY